MPYQLRTFGGWTIVGPEGEPIDAVQPQSKGGALLAYLATRPVGDPVDRAELLPLLWPERREEKSRNALRVTLSRLRDALPEGALGGKGEERIWLQESVLTSDVRSFQRALAEERHRKALRVYRGPFLERYHLADAGPFNRWADERRSEYRRQAYRAAMALGEEAHSAGSLEEAETAFRRALDLAPLKEDAATGLIRVLADRGERTDALQLYRSFRDRLERELGLSPSSDLGELIDRIRSRPVDSAGSSAAVKKEGDSTARDRTGSPTPWLTPGRLMGAVAVIALIGVAVWWNRGSEDATSGSAGEATATRPRPTVAVLPFENLSGSEEARPFVRGLHSELLTRLSGIDGLAVVSRSSAGLFQNTELNLPAVADSLGAEWVLEGGVQQSGDRIQVNAQLIDPDTDTHAWAASYEQELTAENLFRIQEKLTRKIVRALDVELTPEDQRQVASVPTENTAAYELYLEAQRLDEGPVSEEETDRKIRLIRRAIELDSSFAEAWAGLADAYAGRAWRHGWDKAWADSALAAAQRALALDPELARAHMQLGDAHWVLGNTERQLDAYRKAWELNPDLPGVTHNLNVLLARQGRYAESLEWLDRVLPTSPRPAKQVGTLVATNVLLGRDSVAAAWHEYARRRGLDLTEAEFAVALLYRDDVERAKSLLEELADGEETVVDTRRRALVQLYGEDWKRARGLYRRLYSASGGGPGYAHGLFDDRVGLAWSLDRLGQKGEAREIAERVREETGDALENGVPGTAVRHRRAVAHLLLGDTARALDWLEKAVDAGERRLPLLETAPTLDPLRDRPRFQALLDRVAEDLAAQRRRADEHGWGEPPRPPQGDPAGTNR